MDMVKYKRLWYGLAVLAIVGGVGAVASGRPEGVVGWAVLVIPYIWYRLKVTSTPAK